MPRSAGQTYPSPPGLRADARFTGSLTLSNLTYFPDDFDILLVGRAVNRLSSCRLRCGTALTN